jgi:hypothetical protein
MNALKLNLLLRFAGKIIMKKLFLFFALAIAIAGCSKNDTWNEPVIPVSLVGIEAVNIDNSGEFPIVSSSPIKKEAYMVGIKWITDNTPSSADDKFITGSVPKGENTYSGLSNSYSKATPFYYINHISFEQ